MRILIVGSEVKFLRAIRKFLLLRGHTCAAFLRLEDALKGFHTEYYDIVVSGDPTFSPDDGDSVAEFRRIKPDVCFLFADEPGVSGDPWRFNTVENGIGHFRKPLVIAQMEILLDKIGQQLGLNKPAGIPGKHRGKEAVRKAVGQRMHFDFRNVASAVLDFSDLSLLKMLSEHLWYENLDQLFRLERESDTGPIGNALVGHYSDIPLLSVPQILGETLLILRAFLPDTITVDSETQPGLERIFADPVQTAQIFLSLGINSYYEMRGYTRGEVHFGLSETLLRKGNAEGLAEGLYLALEYRDSVRLTSDRQVKMILNPYSSLSVVKRESDLGLFMVKMIAARLRGRVLFNLIGGKERRFRVFLPLTGLVGGAGENRWQTR